MFKSGSKADTALKVLCMGAGSYIVAYTVGPLAGHLAQGLYRNAFYLLYGKPNPWWWWLDLNQWRGWINEGHVFYYAYEYGDKACGLVAAPFFYTLPDLVRYCFTKQKPVDPKDRAILENELKGIHQLRELLHEDLNALSDEEEPQITQQQVFRLSKKAKTKETPQASSRMMTRSRSAHSLL